MSDFKQRMVATREAEDKRKSIKRKKDSESNQRRQKEASRQYYLNRDKE